MASRTVCFLEKLRRPSDNSELDRPKHPASEEKFRRHSDISEIDRSNRSMVVEGSQFQCEMDNDAFDFDVSDMKNSDKQSAEREESKHLETLTSSLSSLNVGQDMASVRDVESDLFQQLGIPKLIPEYPNNPFATSQKFANNIFPSVHPSSFRPSVGSSSDESMLTPNSMSDEAIVPPRRNSSSSSSRLIPAYIWAGELPQRNYLHPVFSCKVFVGGVPWDITEEALVEAFCPYGVCRVEWPGKEARGRTISRGGQRKASGYVYIIFEQDRSVKALLHDCNPLGSAGEWYFRIKAKRNDAVEIRQVQIIPWVVSDSSFVYDAGCRLDIKKTVFVGALHGMITAEVLYNIMDELYGNVVFVGIDTDKHKYPIGSGRVTFSSHTSYFRAIESAFLEIRTSKFSKRVQIDPFLEDAQCMICDEQPGPLFCRDKGCFRYFCSGCWDRVHMQAPELRPHRPLIRNAPRGCRREDFDFSPRNSNNRDWPFFGGDFFHQDSPVTKNLGIREVAPQDGFISRGSNFGLRDNHNHNGHFGRSHGGFVGNGHPGNSVVYPIRVRSSFDNGRGYWNNFGPNSRYGNRPVF